MTKNENSIVIQRLQPKFMGFRIVHLTNLNNKKIDLKILKWFLASTFETTDNNKQTNKEKN